MFGLPYDLLELIAQHTASLAEPEEPRIGAATAGSLALTAHFLREPAQRGLFRSLTFTGWKLDRSSHHKNRRIVVQTALTRVQGLASHSVLQSYIEHLVLRDWVSGHNDRDVWSICEALWELVSMLKHLREVECDDVLFKSESWAKLCGGRRFRRLDLRWCQVPYDDTLEYHVERLYLSQPQLALSWHAKSLAHVATLMVRPSLLRGLFIDAPALVSELLGSLLNVGTFTALKDLALAIAWPLPVIGDFMQRCPNLITFKLAPSPDLEAASSIANLPRGSVPNLKDVAGPPDVVASLMRGRAIRTVLLVLEMDETATMLMFPSEHETTSESGSDEDEDDLAETLEHAALDDFFNSAENDQRSYEYPQAPSPVSIAAQSDKFAEGFDNAFWHLFELAMLKMGDLDERDRSSVTTLTFLGDVAASQELLTTSLSAVQDVFPNVKLGALSSRKRIPVISVWNETAHGRILRLADM